MTKVMEAVYFISTQVIPIIEEVGENSSADFILCCTCYIFSFKKVIQKRGAGDSLTSMIEQSTLLTIVIFHISLIYVFIHSLINVSFSLLFSFSSY